MEDLKQKLYRFYVLTSSEAPDEVRYVGVTTKKVGLRFSLHKYNATHAEKRALPVHKWMYSKYQKGGEIFIKEIDSCGEEEWEDRERYWIDFYKKQGNKLLNLDPGGKGIITVEKRSRDSIERSIEGHEKPVVILHKDGTFYARADSATKAAKLIGAKSKTAVTNALNGWSQSCKGYLLVYEENYDPNKVYEYLPKSLNRRIKVYEFTLDGKLIKIWDKLMDFTNLEGYSENGVRSAIKNKKEYHGSYWSYEDTIDISEYKSPFKYKIICNEKDYYFKNQSELSKFLHISPSQLCTKLKLNINIINNHTIIIL